MAPLCGCEVRDFAEVGKEKGMIQGIEIEDPFPDCRCAVQEGEAGCVDWQAVVAAAAVSFGGGEC